MATSVIRVKDKKELQNKIEDKQVEGYKLVSEGDRSAVMKKGGSFGGLGGHIVVFILTIWWTFGIGNVIYAAYKYLSTSSELQIKVE